MAVRLTVVRYPQSGQTRQPDGPEEVRVSVDRAYRFPESVIAVHADTDGSADAIEEYSRQAIVRVQYRSLTVVTYKEFVKDLSDGSIGLAGFGEETVERLG